MSIPELKGPPGELRFTVEVRRPDGTVKHRADFVGAATPEQARALGAEFVTDPSTPQEPSNGSDPQHGGS